MRSSGDSLLHVLLPRPGFSLNVELSWRDRVAVIFGPSGSGKTTLFECVLGLHSPRRARICLAGYWLDDFERGLRLPTEQRQLGWVPQAPTLFPHLNVLGNLRFGQERARGDAPAILRRAIDVLEIGHLLTRRVAELSGGEQSRVALARAIASSPRVLLLDEPLSALDLPLRARVLPYLLRIRDELDLPMLYITHDPDEAILLGGSVAVLNEGSVIAHGSAREVLWSQAVLPLSEALGLENVLDARVLAEGSESGGCTVETDHGLRLVVPWLLDVGAKVSVGLPAHDLLLAVDEPRGISARNVIPARVARCEQREGGVFVHVDAGEPLVAKLTTGAVERLGLAAGSRVFVIIKAQAIRRVG